MPAAAAGEVQATSRHSAALGRGGGGGGSRHVHFTKESGSQEWQAWATTEKDSGLPRRAAHQGLTVQDEAQPGPSRSNRCLCPEAVQHPSAVGSPASAAP